MTAEKSVIGYDIANKKQKVKMMPIRNYKTLILLCFSFIAQAETHEGSSVSRHGDTASPNNHSLRASNESRTRTLDLISLAPNFPTMTANEQAIFMRAIQSDFTTAACASLELRRGPYRNLFQELLTTAAARPAVVASYRQQSGVKAREALNAASANALVGRNRMPDRKPLIDVFRNYPLTAESIEAGALYAYLSRENFIEASLYYDAVIERARLLNIPLVDRHKLQAAAVFRRAGQTERSQSLLNEIRFPMQIDGHRLERADAMREINALPVPSSDERNQAIERYLCEGIFGSESQRQTFEKTYCLNSEAIRQLGTQVPSLGCLPQLSGRQLANWLLRRDEVPRSFLNLANILGEPSATRMIIRRMAREREIRNLDLSSMHLTQVELATLLNNEDLLRGVTSLDLSGNFISDAGMIALANSPNLRNLTSLNLFENLIRSTGMTALADSPNLRNLTSLDLSENLISDAGMTALANSPNLRNLTSLNLNWNYIGEAGTIALANSPYLRNLTSLNLHGNIVGEAGTTALANSNYLRNATIDLRRNPIPFQRALDLANSRYLRNLPLLTLSNSELRILQGIRNLRSTPLP